MAPKRGLGRGLGALISASENTMQAANEAGILEIELTRIEPNLQQPRKHFDDEALAELAESIKLFGVIQPLIVKEAEDGYYVIVAGERRWRAARIAGLTHLPVIIKDYTDIEVLQVALIENIQRKDLNPIEEAFCYKRLADEFSLTQEEVAKKVGKARNSISYAMGLLNLDVRVQNMLMEGKLTPGHARSLMTLKDHEAEYTLAEKIIEGGLTTRETQELLRQIQEKEVVPQSNEGPAASARQKVFSKPKYSAVENDLQTILGTNVNVVFGKRKGKIEIEYYSNDDLERLIGMFKRLR